MEAGFAGREAKRGLPQDDGEGGSWGKHGFPHLCRLAAVRRGSIFRISLYGLVAAAAVTLVAVLIKWLPTSASRQMDRITFVYWFATVICIGIFAVVMAVIVY